MQNPHMCRLKNGRTIDTSGHPFEGPFTVNPDGLTDVALFHHCLSISRKECIAKRMRGRSDLPGSSLTQADAEALADAWRSLALGTATTIGMKRTCRRWCGCNGW